ncbi:hypothetical protein H9P43_008665 [Blastocladiella emersonii ATCC 22665]|nr:hypothetical protein H9P43_008665 [Blastocladiella emersonii ATCC 22665]
MNEPPAPSAPLMLTCRTPYRGNRVDTYRPFRRLPPRDLFLYHDSCTRLVLKALVCGCGDLAEVARTVCEAAAKGAIATFSFTLNDQQPEVLARNFLILHAIANTLPNELDTDTLARYVGQLWYSVVLDPNVRDFWNGQLRACIEKDWANVPMNSALRVLNSSTLSELRRCWRAWLDVEWPVDTLLAKREQHIELSSGAASSADQEYAKHAVEFMDGVHAQYPGVLEDAESARIACNLERLAGSSAFTVGGRARPVQEPVVNPTMLLISYDSIAYYAIDASTLPTDSFDLFIKQGSPESVMLAEITDWVAALRAGLRGSSPRFRFSFAHGHAVAVMEELAADSAMRYDVVDTNNLMDSCGLLSILIHGCALLRHNDSFADRARLLAYSTAKETEEHDFKDYLLNMTGLVYEAYPALFGVTLVEMLSSDPLASETWYQRFAWSRKHLTDSPVRYLTFAKLPHPTVPTSLTDSTFLFETLLNCAKYFAQGTPFGPLVTTKTFLPKLLGYAFASGRIVASGSALHSSPEWPEAAALVLQIPAPYSKDPTGLADLMSSMLRYGFRRVRESSFTDDRLEVTVPVDGPSWPPSYLALEVRWLDATLRLESLHVEPIYGDSPRLRIRAAIPGVLRDTMPSGATVGVFREEIGWGTDPNAKRELMGGKRFPLPSAIHSRAPLKPFIPLLSGLIGSRPPIAHSWPLSVDRAVEHENQIALTLTFMPGAQTKFTFPERYDVMNGEGAATLLVDGVRQSMRVTSPVRVGKAQVARKDGKLTLLLSRALSVARDIGLKPSFPHIGRRVPASPDSRICQQSIRATLCASSDLIRALQPPPARVEYDSENTMSLLNAYYLPKASDAKVVEFARLIFEAFAAGHDGVAHCGLPTHPVLLVFFDRPVFIPSAGPSMVPTPALECSISMTEEKEKDLTADEMTRRGQILADCFRAIRGRLSVCTLPSESSLAFGTFDFRPIRDPVPATDPRFDAGLYKDLRPILKRVLILPAYATCRSGMDEMGPKLTEFFAKEV